MMEISNLDGLNHGDHTHDSITSITECILGLKERADEKELPGFGGLIDDWFNPDIQVDEEQFVRRFLRVFKQSDLDHTYEDILKGYDDEVQAIVNQFVDGDLDASQAAERYTPFTTLKVPKGIVQKRGLANIVPGERNILEEHTALLRALPTSIPSRLRGLVAKIAPSLKDPKEYLYIPSFKHLEFENHGRTVRYTPTITCVPNTAQDVTEIIKYAKNKNMGVRVSGFRHSWSLVFGSARNKNENKNGDILISTLGLVDASILPNFTSLPIDLFQPEAKDLNSIMFVTHEYVNGPVLSNGKRYVRLGTSTTNEQLRRWCVGTGKVTLPMQIIEVEITMGGSNATICHGAGINNPTLSDLVRCIEYVDANGVLRKIDLSTPAILRAAAGCFGLIGVVTHLVLEFDPISCALMEPRKVPVVEAIPPPPDMKDSEIPAPLRPKVPLTSERKAQVQKDFETRALTHDYAEWFWFPYSSDVWVNTWKKTNDLSGAVDYPNNVKTVLQVFGTIMVNVAQNASSLLNLTQALPEVQTKLLTWLTMKNLDDIGVNGKKIKTWLPDAIHFQRGVQNLRVRDLEIEFPLQPKKAPAAEVVEAGLAQQSASTTPTSGVAASDSTTPKQQPQEIDFKVVQRAWWDAILACYQEIKTCPQRMPLEMRIMSGSDVTLAPQRGHQFGTCSIEILTLHNVADIWPAYAQKVLDKWSSYTDADGKPIPVRPHWAKEWHGYKMKGRLWQDVLKNEVRINGGFREEFAEWRDLVGQLAKRDGWRVADAKKRFGNEALNALVWSEPVAKSTRGVAVANGKPVTSTPPVTNGVLLNGNTPKANGHANGSANGTTNGAVKGHGHGGSGKNDQKSKHPRFLRRLLAKLKAAF